MAHSHKNSTKVGIEVFNEANQQLDSRLDLLATQLQALTGRLDKVEISYIGPRSANDTVEGHSDFQCLIQSLKDETSARQVLSGKIDAIDVRVDRVLANVNKSDELEQRLSRLET